MNKLINKVFAFSSLLTFLCISLYFLNGFIYPRTKDLSMTKKWETKLDNTVQEISTTADKSLILVRTNSAIRALSAATSEIVWEFDLAPQVELSPAISANRTVFIADSRTLWALGQEDGKIIWSQELPETRGWVTDASSEVVLVNQRSNDVRAYNAETGKLLWSIKVGDGNARAYIDNDQVYIPDMGIKFVELFSGKTLWTEGENAIGGSVYQDGVIYYTSGNYIYAYDARNRNDVWEISLTSEGFRKFKICKEYVIVTDAEYLYTFDKTNGNLNWKIRLNYPVNPTTYKNFIFVEEGFRRTIQVYDIETGKNVGSIKLSLIPRIFLVEHQNMISTTDLLVFSIGKLLYAYEEKQ